MDVAGGHAHRVQGEDQLVHQFPGPGDQDVLALVLDPCHPGKFGQQPVQAEQPDRPGVRFPEPDGTFDGGGFPRPVRSQDAEDLTLGHR